MKCLGGREAAGREKTLSREILKNDTSGLERDLNILLGGLLPVEDLLNIRRQHGELVAVAQGGLKQHTNRVREPLFKRQNKK